MTQAKSNKQSRENSGFASGARRKAVETYDGARDGVTDAKRQVGENIDEAPLIALAGGIAAGALIAALLPRTQSETRALRPAAKRLSDTARSAVQAAREAGTSRLGELGLTPDKGREAIRSIFEGASDAAKASAQAALGAARKD